MHFTDPMGFLKRVLPPKAEIILTIGDRKVSKAETTCTGFVLFECKEALVVTEIKLEVEVNENVEEYVNRSGKRYKTMVTYNLFSNHVVLSSVFDAAIGYSKDYPFEITIPRFSPPHNGGLVFTTMRGVAVIKDRPDVKMEINPFGDGILQRWNDGYQDGVRSMVESSQAKEISMKIEENDLEWIRTRKLLPEAHLARIGSDPDYRAGYIEELKEEIPVPKEISEVIKLEGLSKKMRL